MNTNVLPVSRLRPLYKTPLDHIVLILILLWLASMPITLARHNIFQSTICVENDDYCDCGYDEPKTSACSGWDSDALFKCIDTGLSNQSITYSRVNDHICDCCDGSDEAHIQCENKCDEVNSVYIATIHEMNEKWHKGKLLRDHLVEEAGTTHLYITRSLNSNMKLKNQQEIALKTARKQLEKEEARQKEVSKKSLTQLRESALSLLLNSSRRLSSERLLNVLIASFSIIGTEASLQETLLELDDIYESDGDDADDILAFKLRKEYHSRFEPRQSSETVISVDGDSSQGSNIITDDQLMTAIDTMIDALSLTRLSSDGRGDAFFSTMSRALQVNREVSLMALMLQSISVETATNILGLSSEPSNTFDTDKMGDGLRINIKSLEEKISGLKKEIENARGVAKIKSFGQDHYLFALYGNCFNIDDKGYKYEICPFKEAKQNQILLGRYSKFEEFTDKTLKKVKLYFEQGEYCHAAQSPRSITILLECSLETRLKDIDEPSVCSYTAVLETPLACFHDPYQ